MHNTVNITNDLVYLGGNDRRIALFESAYPVPRGVSYNSYLLLDKKTILFDTVDQAVSELFFENLAHALGGRPLDCIIVHHMEPDHAASLKRLFEKYPKIEVIANKSTAVMLKNYFGYEGATIVKEGDVLQTGKHTLRFVLAPLVHWPEVMFTFDETTGTLFSADAFGTFGALPGSIFADELNFERDYLNDARRYYFNIVGKFGVQVQNALKKAGSLDIKTICPLHGPVWRKDISYYLQKYDLWSKYLPETKGVVIFYASVYGHTQNAAEILARSLNEAGMYEVRLYDVAVTDASELLSEAFRYSHAVFCAPTVNNGIFKSMEDLLRDLQAHNYQNRAYSIVENGSWSPLAGGHMESLLSAMKDMRKVGEKVSVLSAVNDAAAEKIRELAKAIAASE